MITEIRINTIATTLLIGILFLFGSVSTIAQTQKIKKPFPAEISKKIRFGMSKADFMEEFPEAKISTNENFSNFKTVISQQVSGRNIREITYYFGTKGNEPLYEMIVNFNSESLAESKALELLKQANHKNKEWRYIYKKQPLWCWVFKSKIVYVAKIPDTEWYSEWDQR